jgi:hypothetical protein
VLVGRAGRRASICGPDRTVALTGSLEKPTQAMTVVKNCIVHKHHLSYAGSGVAFGDVWIMA